MATRRKTHHINTPANGTHLGQDRLNHANELKKWFCKLTPEERGRVLLVDDKDGNNILRKMFQTRKGKGEVLFYRGIAEDLDLPPQLKRKIGASLTGNDFFYLKINSLSTTCFYPEKFLITDKALEDSVRLCDTREYLDTFTLTSNLFEDGKEFLKLMQVVTRGNFLSTPCRVSYDASNKVWLWEGPKWFEGMGYYSLGTWISHKIEKALWMRYWDSHRLDPRTKNYSLPYTFPNILEGLLSKNYLIQFWKSHNTQERRKIVGSIGDIVRHVIFNSNNDDSDKNKYKQGLDYPRLLSQLVDITTQERNLEVLFDDRDLAQNEKTFIEILYFSPLDRAGTAIDMVLRRIGMSIHSAYTEKISMDLIVGEEAEKIKQAAQSEAKKKRRKKKKDKVTKKKKEQQEKENKEKEQKDREEKERKERERMAQEHQRIRKAITLMIGDIITNAEQTIEQKKRLKEQADEEERCRLAASILSPQTNDKENEVVANPNSKTTAIIDAKRKSKSRKKNKKKLQSSTDLIFETRAESKEVNGSADEPPVTDQIVRINRTLYHRREEYIIRLHQEIEDYASMTKSIIKTYYAPRVDAIIEKLLAIATSLWQNAHIKVYGSYATSLCIPSSDLDLVIMGANSTMPGNALRLLANGLSRRRWVQDIQLIDTAKVPIIKLTTSPECIRTDIAVNDDYLHAPFYFCSEGIAQHSGVAACELVKGYIKKMPGMTSMVLLLKQYLQERGLNNSYTGGLSSYGLTLMVISYLQLFGAKKNMGLLLIDILDYYGKKFDFNTTGITVSNGGNHFALDEGFRFPPAPVVIVDPFNPSHNIAAGSFAIYRVKAALEELHNVLITTLDNGISSSPVLSRVLIQQPARNIDLSKFSLKAPRKQALRC